MVAVIPDLALCYPPTSVSSPPIARHEVHVPDFDIKGVPPVQRDVALFATATKRALGRRVVLGRRMLRLLEPGISTCQQFRGRMDVQTLLLVEDGAVTWPLALDARAIRARADENVGRLSAEHSQP